MIKIPLYECTINVLIFESIEDSDKHIRKVNKKYNLDFEEGGYEGYVLKIDIRTYHLLLIKKYIGENVISHECYHISEFIADSHGLSNKNEKEERAYLNGYINEKVRLKIKGNVLLP